MVQGSTPVHPYIPNSAPETKAEMLRAIGVDSIDEFFAVIPAKLRMNRPLDLPPALAAEAELERHVTRLLGSNTPVTQALSFLGSGCYPHHVPAVCDEINHRAEFLTAYAGEPYEDHGKWQAIFEYTSLMAELLEMDVVNVPTYDGYQAAATAIRMAGRITGRPRVIVTDLLAVGKRDKIHYSIRPGGEVVLTRAGTSGGDDPVLGQFLNFLARDIASHPERLQGVDADFVHRLQALAGGIEVDLDAALSADDE